MDMRLLEALPGGKVEVPSHLQGTVFLFCSHVFLAPTEGLSGPSVHCGTLPSPAEPGSFAWYLVDFQEAIHLATFILLLLHLLAEALSPALLDGIWVLEGPASAAISFPHIFTRVTAPATVCGLSVLEVQGQHRYSGKQICSACLHLTPQLASCLTPKCVS